MVAGMVVHLEVQEEITWVIRMLITVLLWPDDSTCSCIALIKHAVLGFFWQVAYSSGQSFHENFDFLDPMFSKLNKSMYNYLSF